MTDGKQQGPSNSSFCVHNRTLKCDTNRNLNKYANTSIIKLSKQKGFSWHKMPPKNIHTYAKEMENKNMNILPVHPALFYDFCYTVSFAL